MRFSSAAIAAFFVICAAAYGQQQPGRVEGTVRAGNEVKSGTKVMLASQSPTGARTAPREAQTDAQGHYAFDQVSPGRYMVGIMGEITVRNAHGYTTVGMLGNGRGVIVKPGETAVVDIGGAGRKVVGRLTAPENSTVKIAWQGGDMRRLMREVDFPKPPAELSKPEAQAWAMKMMETPEFHALWSQSSMHLVDVAEDGSFSVSDVPPGNYTLVIEVGDDAGTLHEPAGTATAKVTVPEGPADQPVDIGAVPVKLAVKLKPGDPAPAFSVKSADGKQISLADYKGKYVLLDFWATWCGPCRAEMPYVKAVYDRYKDDARFAVLGLNLDPQADSVKKFTEANEMPWPQGLLGNWGDTDVPENYGVRGIPAMFLVDPEGKIAAVDLRGSRISEAVEKALNAAK